MSTSASPILHQERADILDALRGFALLGVLLDNLMAFSGWGFLSQPAREALPTWPADGLFALLELAFIKGKFYSLFSLLFGIGFSIILIRNERKGIHPYRIFYRRLFILFLIGAIHLYFFWEGDILVLYALIGCLLPLFRKCKDRTLLIWAFALILSPVLIDAIKVTFHFETGHWLERIAQRIDIQNGVPVDDSFAYYLNGEDSGFREWWNTRPSGFFWRYSDLIEDNRIPKVLGMFLIGFWVGRKMLYANLEQNRKLLKKVRKWGFIIGIPASLATAYFFIDEKSVPAFMGLADTVCYALGVVPLALAYASVFGLVWLKRNHKPWTRVLAPMGRMALTNYLMQTVFGILIYYGLGLGLGGNIGPAVFFPIGLAVYSFQVLYSHLWFRYFNYGPFEWIWRQLTYGSRLTIRKQKI